MNITKKSAAKNAAEQAAAEQAVDKQKTKIKTANAAKDPEATKEMAEDAVPAKAGRQCKSVAPALPEAVPHLPAYGVAYLEG